MIQKQIDAISKSDIDELIANSVNESKTLEYKQELPALRDTLLPKLLSGEIDKSVLEQVEVA